MGKREQTNLSRACRQAAYELFEQANKSITAANLLIMAALELDEAQAQLNKYAPKPKKPVPDVRQRVFMFDLEKSTTWADLDREIAELEREERRAAAR